MPITEEMVTVGEAARALGVTPQALRNAVKRNALTVVPLDRRTNLIARDEVERYRREHLGQRGKRKNKKAPATGTPAESD